jgi:hypothetical protein
MIEVNMTYLGQTHPDRPRRSGVDAKVLCAPVSATLFQTQFEFGFAWANEESTRKQYGPLSADTQVACCSTPFDEKKVRAGKLSEGFPEVRVDLYECNEKVFFGEMTFFLWSGLMP